MPRPGQDHGHTPAMLSSKPRSSDGCWTCRLRRKKCDEERPACAACLSLEIECLYSDAKPEWMDGADLQRDRAEAVKKLIKRKAAWRRERRHLQGLESGLGELEMTDGLDGLHVSTAAAATAPRQPAASSSPPPNGHGHGHDHAQAPQPPPPPRPDSSQYAAPSPPSPGGPASSMSGFSPPCHLDSSQGTSPESTAAEATTHRHTVMFGNEHERDIALSMTYCDSVFPFLFPFYRPQMLLGGRSWLLIVLGSNRTLFHSALSLASYFFTSMLHGGENVCCRAVSHDEMYRQQNLTVKELMLDVNDINQNGVKGRLKEATRVLAAIMQVLCFEVAIGNTGGSSWALHLEGAIALLDQVFKLNAETLNNIVCWNSILRRLDEREGSHPQIFFPSAIGQQTVERPMTMMNSNQSCLSFFAAVLLYFDIVSSTALEAAPRLHCYHVGLLHGKRDILDMNPDLKEMLEANVSEHSGLDTPLLDLSQVMGAANWALTAVGDVAALDAWKKQQRASGSLSVTELVLRGAKIEWPLRQRIASLDSILCGGGECQSIVSQPHQPQRPLPIYVTARARVGDFERGPRTIGGVDGSLSTSWVTRIWAQAALSYLHVVVNGWQPASPALRESVGLTLTLLRTRLPSPDCLRTFAWPLAVTGCLASPEEEEPLRQLVRDVGPLDIFGSVKQAWMVMEGVWARRAEVENGEGGEWDIARCFGVGNQKVFLV
ncbi:hypothetical protein RB597_006577 [Gaeumannomyces tritici]